MTTVLYFQASGKVSARQKLEGVYVYGRDHGWDVQVVEPETSERKAAELAEFWTPDGIIVECGSGQNHFDPAIFGKTPVVFLDRNPKTLNGSSFCVTHDSIATAKVAARELLSLKLQTYAYVPWPEPRFWSDEREKGFAAALRLNNRGYVRFSGRAKASDIRSLQKELDAWLKDLPKPVGIFAANDFMSAQVATAASRAKLNIPDDIALVGVDNDELLCENTNPTLSSVMPDFRSAGEKAAALLARRMANPKCRSTAETFGPLWLVRRTSTCRSKRIDRDVLTALDLIRREACNGLKARDVFASFTCTRRMAEIRFRAATGKSPLEAIHEIRRAKAEELLLKDPTRDRNAIANLCGYSSANALANFLRRCSAKLQTRPYRRSYIFAATSRDAATISGYGTSAIVRNPIW